MPNNTRAVMVNNNILGGGREKSDPGAMRPPLANNGALSGDGGDGGEVVVGDGPGRFGSA